MHRIHIWLAALALAGTLAACTQSNSPENARAENRINDTDPAPTAAETPSAGNGSAITGNGAGAADVLARVSEVQFQTQLASDYFPLDGNDIQRHPVITDAAVLEQLTGKNWQAEFQQWGQAGLSPLAKATFNGRIFVLLRSKFLNGSAKYHVVGVVLDAQNQPLAAKVLFSPGQECAGVPGCHHTVTLTRQGVVECRYIQRSPAGDERVVLRAYPVFNNPPLESTAP